MTDPFSSARDAFIKQEHVMGRLLLISPLSSGERESNLPGSQGKTYTYIETDTVVLDGPVDDMVDEVPMQLEGFQYSGQAITAQLMPAVRKSTMILGRLGQKPARPRGSGTRGSCSSRPMPTRRWPASTWPTRRRARRPPRRSTRSATRPSTRWPDR